MHKVIFYPVQNGDTSQIILSNGKRLLFDFRHLNKGENEDEPVIDLKSRLRSELTEAKRDYYDVLALTHADLDHISHSTEFFELLHAKKYQGDGRIKVRELWVPAAMLLESSTIDQRSAEFVIWRREAQHRLREGKGIKVFSKPEMLKNWLAHILHQYIKTSINRDQSVRKRAQNNINENSEHHSPVCPSSTLHIDGINAQSVPKQKFQSGLSNVLGTSKDSITRTLCPEIGSSIEPIYE